MQRREMQRGSTDVLIIGGGALGLNLADQLTAAGRGVMLLDNQPELASGSSTRNARTVRYGHTDALRISNGLTAVREAARAREGFNRTAAIAPDAVRLGGDTYIPVYTDTDTSQFATRLAAAGLPYSEVSPQHVREHAPGLNTDELVSAIPVPDQGIDSRQVYNTLTNRILRRGGIILTDANVQARQDEHHLAVRVGDSTIEIAADAVVVAAGYRAEGVFQRLTDSDAQLGLQLGQAPVLRTREAVNTTLLPIDDARPSVTAYDGDNLFTQNDLTTPIDEPRFDVPIGTELALLDAAASIVPGVERLDPEIHACLTVNARDVQGTYRVPEWDIVYTDAKILFAWPGMMTKAPVMAERIVAELQAIAPDQRGTVSLPDSLPQASIRVAQYPYGRTLSYT